jgi:uncharacterized protein involved in response to NO
MPDHSRRPYLSLCVGEPFRLFFPLGALVGISGVSLWPLFFSGMHHSFYPGMMHARLMIQGFLGAFVFGFLGTALPRLTGTNPLTRGEFWTLVALYVATVAVHIAERPLGGDVLFLLLLLFFLTCLGRRFAKRTDLPPPGFVLVALGFGNALAGTILAILGATQMWGYATLLGNSLLHVGWVLLLVLGIGAFLLPRFLGLRPNPAPDSPLPPPGWWPRAFKAMATGVIITGTLIAEVYIAMPRTWALVRTLAAGAYLLSTIPLLRADAPRVTLTRSLRVALVLLIAGLAFSMCWPLQRVAGLHVIFLGGFSLITLTVATRVVLGHSGQSDRFATPLLPLIATAALIVIATVLRALGDFLPAARPTWLTTASYVWMLGVAIWSWRILPSVRVPDSE